MTMTTESLVPGEATNHSTPPSDSSTKTNTQKSNNNNNNNNSSSSSTGVNEITATDSPNKNNNNDDDDDNKEYPSPAEETPSPAQATPHDAPNANVNDIANFKPAPPPRVPAWGLSSESSASTAPTSSTSISSSTSTSTSTRFADIVRDQSHDRAAARLVYAEPGGAAAKTLTLAEIQAEQERLFASLAIGGSASASGGNGNSGNASEPPTASAATATDLDEEERRMIELALKQSLADCHPTEIDIDVCTETTHEQPDATRADLDGNARKDPALFPASVTIDDEERAMIEAAIREADERERERQKQTTKATIESSDDDDDDDDDAKPAAAAAMSAAASYSAKDDAERAMIEAAIREADERERQKQTTGAMIESSSDDDDDDAKPAAAATASSSTKNNETANNDDNFDAERAMIEAAIREADERERQITGATSGFPSDDAKPPAAAAALVAAAASSATNAVNDTDAERAMIEAAIREADALERQTAEAESLRLVLQLQQEELAMARQQQRQQQQASSRTRTSTNTGNVRTMTRAELEAETYGSLAAANTGRGNDDIDYDDELEIETGFRINPQQLPLAHCEWQRKDRNTIVGPNRETRTKHDVHLQGQANASFLDLDVTDDDHRGGLRRTHVGNTAFNAFRKTFAGMGNNKGGHRGTSKGVATHGTGRAGTDSDATKGGALDQHVRLHISRAINAGIIERCNGVVKQGKEAVVYHAVGGTSNSNSNSNSNGLPTVAAAANTGANDGDDSTNAAEQETAAAIARNDGHDVAIKVFKRIKEFKGRGEYVDGDPRYAGRSFKSFTDREQLEVWTEKEYRNLVRAYRAKVPVPNPIHYKENVLFMRFLGQDGWPAPQIREIEVRRGSSKWTALYEQVMESVRRLFRDARLVHGDLSEYNILVAPNSQVDHHHESVSDSASNSETASAEGDLQTVLIDFGQAVEVRHPKAEELLKRDLSRVREFFEKKKGVTTTRNDEDAFLFVAGDHSFSLHRNDCAAVPDDT